MKVMIKSVLPPTIRAGTRHTPLERALQWSADLPIRLALLWLGALWLAVAALDAGTGPQITVTSLYALPLCFTTWCLGRVTGLAAGATALAFTLGVNGFGDGLSAQAASASVAVGVWNVAMRLFWVIFFILLVGAFRRTFDRERLNARVDPLTGLGNRRAFEIESRKLALACARDERALLCGLIDLDDFKTTNDRFGHADGDTVLQTAASALLASVRPYDVTARLGGDEFAFCLAVRDVAAGERKAGDIHARLSQALAQDGSTSTCSLGATIDQDVAQGLRTADAAMYRSKRTGKGQWIFISPDAA